MTLPIFSPSAVEIVCDADWSAWFFEATGGILTGLNFAGRIDAAVKAGFGETGREGRSETKSSLKISIKAGSISLRKRLGVPNSNFPYRHLFLAQVRKQYCSARVIATYNNLRSSSNSRALLEAIGLGKIFSSIPTMKTVGNSKPFAA